MSRYTQHHDVPRETAVVVSLLETRERVRSPVASCGVMNPMKVIIYSVSGKLNRRRYKGGREVLQAIH